jgi:hypothetical protein
MRFGVGDSDVRGEPGGADVGLFTAATHDADLFTNRPILPSSVADAEHPEHRMDELNGRMIACQILITGLIARVANNSPDPLAFLTGFRDEILAVVRQINIAGMDDAQRVRSAAQKTVDEMFSLMKPPSSD